MPPELETHQEADLRFASSSQPDFQAATRHGTRVRWIKRALPVIVIVTALGIGANAVISNVSTDELPSVDIGRLTLAGTSLTMELPNLSGFTDDERGYSVTAKTASQDLEKPDHLKLSGLEARMDLADDGWATLAADYGTVNIKSQVIYLSHNIKVAMNGGYGGLLRRATINVKKGQLESDMPVTFTYLDDAKLTADSLTVLESGDKAVFEGHVQVDFVPSKLREAASDTPSGKPATTGAGQKPSAPAASPAPSAPSSSPAPAAPASPGTAGSSDGAMNAPPPTSSAPAMAALPHAASSGLPAAMEPDMMESAAPHDMAMAPLPPRKPAPESEADVPPLAYAPLPPLKPVPYP